MSPFADDAEAAHGGDLEFHIAKVPETPAREGLPPGFRMRADSHYVEQLDTPAPSADSASAPRTTSRRIAQENATRESKPDTGAALASCASALDSALRSIASTATLLSAPSPVTRGGAARLVDGESQRALRLLSVIRVLAAECAVRRAAVSVFDLLQKVRESLEHEYHACGFERSIGVNADRALFVYGSEELLLTAVASAVEALTVTVAPGEPRQFEIHGTLDARSGSVVISVSEPGFFVPQRWVERAFDEPWPVTDGGTALALLQAARQIARSHAGSLALQASDDATELRFTLASVR